MNDLGFGGIDRRAIRLNSLHVASEQASQRKKNGEIPCYLQFGLIVLQPAQLIQRASLRFHVAGSVASSTPDKGASFEYGFLNSAWMTVAQTLVGSLEIVQTGALK